MFRKCISFAVFGLGALAMVVAGIAQQGPTEAPTGFDTPTLAQDPGSQSVSNGIAEPSGDTYALDQTRFEQVNSRKSAPAITTPMAISWPRPFLSTTGPTLLQIARLLTTVP
jgi:hypothetical protein